MRSHFLLVVAAFLVTLAACGTSDSGGEAAAPVGGMSGSSGQNGVGLGGAAAGGSAAGGHAGVNGVGGGTAGLGGSGGTFGLGGKAAAGGSGGSTGGGAGNNAAGSGGTGPTGGSSGSSGQAGSDNGGSGGQTAGGSGGQETGGSGGSTPSGPCGPDATEITALPACSAKPADTVDVPSGCLPTIDGVLHAAEWADAACYVVGGGDMTVEVKFAGDALLIATSGIPACGCPFFAHFDPDHGVTANGDEFALSLFDDPFGKDGDFTFLTLQNGQFAMATKPDGLVTACPGNMPTPVRYEISIPFATLGITAGSAKEIGHTILHAGAAWPTAVVPDTGMSLSTKTATWGKLVSSVNWH